MFSTHTMRLIYMNGQCPSLWVELFCRKRSFSKFFDYILWKERGWEAKVNNRKNHFFLFPMEYLNSKYFSMSCFLLILSKKRIFFSYYSSSSITWENHTNCITLVKHVLFRSLAKEVIKIILWNSYVAVVIIMKIT